MKIKRALKFLLEFGGSEHCEGIKGARKQSRKNPGLEQKPGLALSVFN